MVMLFATWQGTTVNLSEKLKPRVACVPSQSLLTSAGRFFRRLGQPSSRIDVAISLVEVNHAVQFGSLEILTPDGLLLLMRGFDAGRFRCSNFWPVDRQRFGQHAAVHRPRRFDAKNPQDGRRDIQVAG